MNEQCNTSITYVKIALVLIFYTLKASRMESVLVLFPGKLYTLVTKWTLKVLDKMNCFRDIYD